MIEGIGVSNPLAKAAFALTPEAAVRRPVRGQRQLRHRPAQGAQGTEHGRLRQEEAGAGARGGAGEGRARARRLDPRPLRGGEGREADLGEPAVLRTRTAPSRPSATSLAPATACSGASGAHDRRGRGDVPRPRGRPGAADRRARDLGAAVVERVEVEWPDVSALPDGGRAQRPAEAPRPAAGGEPVRRRRPPRSGSAETPAAARRASRGSTSRWRRGAIGSSARPRRPAATRISRRGWCSAAGAGRSVRVGVEDVRVHGTPPLPARRSRAGGAGRRSARAPGGTEPPTGPPRGRSLEPASTRSWSRTGWRLPDRADAPPGVGRPCPPKG